MGNAAKEVHRRAVLFLCGRSEHHDPEFTGLHLLLHPMVDLLPSRADHSLPVFDRELHPAWGNSSSRLEASIVEHKITQLASWSGVFVFALISTNAKVYKLKIMWKIKSDEIIPDIIPTNAKLEEMN